MFHRIAILCLCSAAILLPVAPVLAAPVDINSADAATLAKELKGVGDTKAAAIVEYRRAHGAFKTLDDLALVKGIGQKLVDRNRADLRLGHVAPGAATATLPGKAVAAAPAGGAARK
jgi:competence protein ComEA